MSQPRREPGSARGGPGQRDRACRWHGWEFDLLTGQSLADPRVRLKRYDVIVEDDTVSILLYGARTGYRHARFRMPSIPTGWEGADLVRIIDPRGEAIAWLAPGQGGACIGCAIRESTRAGGDWEGMLVPGPPESPRQSPPRYGCTPIGDGLRDLGWRLAERDPTSATLIAMAGGKLIARMLARIDERTLHLDLTGDGVADGGFAIAIPSLLRDRIAIVPTGTALTVTEQRDHEALRLRITASSPAISVAIGLNPRHQHAEECPD